MPLPALRRARSRPFPPSSSALAFPLKLEAPSGAPLFRYPRSSRSPPRATGPDLRTVFPAPARRPEAQNPTPRLRIAAGTPESPAEAQKPRRKLRMASGAPELPAEPQNRQRKLRTRAGTSECDSELPTRLRKLRSGFWASGGDSELPMGLRNLRSDCGDSGADPEPRETFPSLLPSFGGRALFCPMSANLGSRARPNGPAELSPGMRPQADSLGKRVPATPRPEGPRECDGVPGRSPTSHRRRPDPHSPAHPKHLLPLERSRWKATPGRPGRDPEEEPQPCLPDSAGPSPPSPSPSS
jgi:hypothetical protein